MSNILIVSSCIHKELASRQRELCIGLLKNAGYDYNIELLEAGVYEIPFVINTYQQKQTFDGYIALGLVINANREHSQYTMSHIHYCFTQFALNQIVVGNGIISGASKEELSEKLESSDPCLSSYPSAFNAVDSLIQFKKRVTLHFEGP